MRSHFLRFSLVTLFALAAAGAARAQVCVRIDEGRDTLAPEERTAALMLIARQFEIEGEKTATDNCAATYTVSHVRLGNRITVTMTGPMGQREGTALGLEDLPPLYSQMVRSLVTGRSMDSLGIVDRTNVTAAQDLPPRRVASDSFWYARLGYSGVFADQTYGAPAMGFGYRAEFDKFGVDFSFLNYAIKSGTYDYYGTSGSAFSGSILRLQGMYFANSHSNSTPYFGGGMSWGGTDVSNAGRNWSGSGLQGDLTAGYEIGRATSVRVFMQADAVLPFYEGTSQTYTYQRLANGSYNYYVPPTVSMDHRYTPSLVFSIGIGWQKGRR
jgi:hypothetical protein